MLHVLTSEKGRVKRREHKGVGEALQGTREPCSPHTQGRTAWTAPTLPYCCCKEQRAPGVAHAFNLNIWEAEQVGLCEFKTSLIYIVEHCLKRRRRRQTENITGLAPNVAGCQEYVPFSPFFQVLSPLGESLSSLGEVSPDPPAHLSCGPYCLALSFSAAN